MGAAGWRDAGDGAAAGLFRNGTEKILPKPKRLPGRTFHPGRSMAGVRAAPSIDDVSVPPVETRTNTTTGTSADMPPVGGVSVDQLAALGEPEIDESKYHYSGNVEAWQSDYPNEFEEVLNIYADYYASKLWPDGQQENTQQDSSTQQDGQVQTVPANWSGGLGDVIVGDGVREGEGDEPEPTPAPEPDPTPKPESTPDPDTIEENLSEQPEDIEPTIEGISNYIQGEETITYSVDDLGLDKIDANGLAIVADALGNHEIPFDVFTEKINTLQTYWGYDDTREGKSAFIATLREIYYEETLDKFIAGADQVNRDDLPIRGAMNGIDESEAALAKAILFLSSTPGGESSDGKGNRFKNEPLVFINIGNEDIGFDHVIAGLDAYYNPIDGIEDEVVRKGVRFFGANPDEDFDSLSSVTFVGDMAALVGKVVENGIPGFYSDLESSRKLEFSNSDFEGDIMATVIVNSGMLEDEGLSIGQVIQKAYDVEGDIYSNRYGLFAEAVGLDYDLEQGKISSSSRKEFEKNYINSIESLAFGLYLIDYKNTQGISSNKPLEIIKEMGEEGKIGKIISAGVKIGTEKVIRFLNFDNSTETVLNWFLDELENKISQ